MRPGLSFIIFFITLSAFALKLSAQTCTGSLGTPVINETFGAGTTSGIGPPLDPSFTTLQYFADACGGEDGQYTLLTELKSGCKGGTWEIIGHDHTQDPYGYMMIINAAESPSVFFTYKVKGNVLCPNTTYQFAAWIMNILRKLPQTDGYPKPNITFSIEKTDGTVLKTYKTGDIESTTDANSWIQYGTFFTSPADGSDIVVKMINNGSGGNGNDLALDDITFTPCGPLIQTGFGVIGNNLAQSNCQKDNLDYTLVAQQTGYTDPVYQWQQNKNDGSGWIDIPGETALTYKVKIPNAVAGEYQYRIGVLNKANIGADNCRIFSDPLTINVFPPPDVKLLANTGGCIGRPLQLLASGGDTYVWTGPNNFTSTESSPVITNSSSPADDGLYQVLVTKNNCPIFVSTIVTVYPTPTVDAINDTEICEGGSVQLAVSSKNATHFKWEPSEGLDHDDISNPVASPLKTTKYAVTVSNDGCADVKPVASFTLTVLNKPAANAGKTIKMFEGQTTKLAGTAAGDKVTFHWTPTDYLDDPASLTPTTSSPNDITYTLHVESTAGCGQSTSTVFVRVYKLLTIVNTFSPNGDGVNDFWYIKNIENYPNADISVFTRYGQRVSQNIGYSKPWDGNYKGAVLPAGTYYYIIDLKDDNLPKQSGWVFIVR
jgi:gliding motility-associated-like protein